MYAILQHGGRQYRVGPGERLLVDRLDATIGTVVGLEPILFLHDEAGNGSSGTTDNTDGARVAASVVSHRRGKKLRVYRYKPKKRYRRTIGYRSDLTELLIEAIVAKGEPLPKATVIATKPAADRPAGAARKKKSDGAGASSKSATAEGTTKSEGATKSEGTTNSKAESAGATKTRGAGAPKADGAKAKADSTTKGKSAPKPESPTEKEKTGDGT